MNVVNGDRRFEPHVAIAKLADGSMPADDWKATCESLGISGSALAVRSQHQAKIA